MLLPLALFNPPGVSPYQAIPYPDRWIKLLCIPLWAVFFRHVAEPARLVDLLRSWQYYIDILFMLAAAYLLWQLNLYIIHWADRRYSWAEHPTQRLMVQGTLAYGITSTLIVLLSLTYYNLILLEPQQLNFSYLLLTDVPVNLMYVSVIHMVYTGLWMIRYHKQKVAALLLEIEHMENMSATIPAKDSVESFKKTLLVNQGRGLVPLAADQLACIFTANEACFVRTHEGKTYTVDGTLEQLLEQLSPKDFFRISRQFVVHRGAIKRVDGESSGRLLLHLLEGHPASLTVSRRRTQEFKQWMEA